MIVEVILRCHHCRRTMHSVMCRRKTCVYCKKTFDLFPKGKKSNVLGIEKGSHIDFVKQMEETRREKRRESLTRKRK